MHVNVTHITSTLDAVDTPRLAGVATALGSPVVEVELDAGQALLLSAAVLLLYWYIGVQRPRMLSNSALSSNPAEHSSSPSLPLNEQQPSPFSSWSSRQKSSGLTREQIDTRLVSFDVASLFNHASNIAKTALTTRTTITSTNSSESANTIMAETTATMVNTRDDTVLDMENTPVERQVTHCVISFGQEACAICLEEWTRSADRTVRRLPCEHIFHRGMSYAFFLIQKLAEMITLDMFTFG